MADILNFPTVSSATLKDGRRLQLLTWTERPGGEDPRLMTKVVIRDRETE